MSDEMQPLPPIPTVPPDVASTKAPARWRLPLVWGLAGVVIGAGAVGGAWAMSDSKPAVVASFTLTGSLVLAGDNLPSSDGTTCAGYEGYSDIADGTDVTVYDSAGDVVAEGSLGTGAPTDSGQCEFPVEVSHVPGGSKFYLVEISHRGKLTVSASDARAGRFAATLGD